MLEIGVIGVAGRMGKTLVQCIQERSGLHLSAATEVSGSSLIGTDVGELCGLGKSGLTVSERLQDTEFDVLVDFSRPEASLQHLDICRTLNKRLVIGTTGFDATGLHKIRSAAEDIAIVFAPNMSVGINLSLKLLQLCAEVLGDDVDIEIFEAHHRHKLDAPSGTALKMGEVVAQALGRDLKECAIYGRQGSGAERDRKTIGFSTLRGGDIVGEHTVYFISEGERIEVTHKASSRKIYANGALRAAAWVIEKEKGLFDMQDMLGLR